VSTVDLTTTTFNETVETSEIVMVDFWASWCGPCRSFAPVYDKVSKEFPDVVFGKIDTEAEQELAASFDITSIPTLLAIREGVVLFMQPGALPEGNLRELVTQLVGIDMDQVRADIAASDAGDQAR